MKQNRAILSLRQVAVCVEGSAAEGTLDQFKADVLFLLAGPQMGIKKKEPRPFISTVPQSNHMGQTINLKPGAGAGPPY